MDAGDFHSSNAENVDAERHEGGLVIQAEPDVWWGPDGVDSLAWADGISYEVAASGGV